MLDIYPVIASEERVLIFNLGVGVCWSRGLLEGRGEWRGRMDGWMDGWRVSVVCVVPMVGRSVW